MKVTRKTEGSDTLRMALAGLAGTESRVGWFPSAVYEGGQPVAGVAAVQEFGSPSRGIPPRSFMRSTASEKREEWAKTALLASKAAINGQISGEQVAEVVALAAEGHIRQTITKISEPPLAASTVAARKRRLANGGAGAKSSITKPLVDTGIMLNSLSSETVIK